MKTIHDVFAIINIVGCLGGMWLMALFYTKFQFKENEKLWVTVALMCFAFCFLGIIRELYTLSIERVSAWPMKFVNAGSYFIAIAFYYLVKYFKKDQED
jgi:hypothetical protein